MLNVMSAVVVNQPKETDLASLINEHHSKDIDYKVPESVPNVWVDKYWLIRALAILFSSPAFVPLQEQKISLEIEKNEQYVIIHIKRQSEQELYCGHGEIGFESCQIGIEQQGGYLNWEQPTENELEFKLGLPIFDENNSL